VEEVSYFSGESCKAIISVQTVLVEGLKLPAAPRPSPESLVLRIASLASISDTAIKMHAQELCRRISSRGILESLHPEVVAACAIVVAALLSGHRISLSRLSAAAFASPSALTAGYGKLMPFLVLSDGKMLVPADLLARCPNGALTEEGPLPRRLERAGDKDGTILLRQQATAVVSPARSDEGEEREKAIEAVLRSEKIVAKKSGAKLTFDEKVALIKQQGTKRPRRNDGESHQNAGDR
jgi:hypothetical protein